MADASALSGCFVIFPFHFGTCKFHDRDTISKMGFVSFPLHGKGGIIGTAGNPVFIKRDISFFSRSFFQAVRIDFNGIKRSITRESSGIDVRMLFKEIFQDRDEGLKAFDMPADSIHRQARTLSSELMRIETEALEKQAAVQEERSK